MALTVVLAIFGQSRRRSSSNTRRRSSLAWCNSIAVAIGVMLHRKGFGIFPFLFITIACGAVSGFHCLKAERLDKQISSEPDARFVGYGGMLTEGFLATLVILACGAGLGMGVMAEGKTVVGEAAWAGQRFLGCRQGLGREVGAFVDGSADFLMAIGLTTGVAVALMGVLVASFAGTALDTACRLQGRHSGNRKNPEPE